MTHLNDREIFFFEKKIIEFLRFLLSPGFVRAFFFSEEYPQCVNREKVKIYLF